MRMMGPGHPAVRIAMVELTSDRYSVPKGTLGYVRELVGDEHAAVQWVDNPGPGGGSVPVALSDLESKWMLSVEVPESEREKELLRVLGRVEIVAKYWRDSAMAMVWHNPDRSAEDVGTAHACAMVLQALDGETEPAEMGVKPDSDAGLELQKINGS